MQTPQVKGFYQKIEPISKDEISRQVLIFMAESGVSAEVIENAKVGELYLGYRYILKDHITSAEITYSAKETEYPFQRITRIAKPKVENYFEFTPDVIYSSYNAIAGKSPWSSGILKIIADFINKSESTFLPLTQEELFDEFESMNKSIVITENHDRIPIGDFMSKVEYYRNEFTFNSAIKDDCRKFKCELIDIDSIDYYGESCTAIYKLPEYSLEVISGEATYVYKIAVRNEKLYIYLGEKPSDDKNELNSEQERECAEIVKRSSENVDKIDQNFKIVFEKQKNLETEKTNVVNKKTKLIKEFENFYLNKLKKYILAGVGVVFIGIVLGMITALGFFLPLALVAAICGIVYHYLQAKKEKNKIPNDIKALDEEISNYNIEIKQLGDEMKKLLDEKKSSPTSVMKEKRVILSKYKPQRLKALNKKLQQLGFDTVEDISMIY